jgi:quercetin dioxygenase-like cupin family protein
MKRISTALTLLAVALGAALLKPVPAHAEGEMEVSRDAARPASPGPAENFTGEVFVKPLFNPSVHTRTSAGQVTFGPSARSAWHIHPAGQTLIVTSGTGWVQQWGRPKQEIKPGDVIWTPPGVKHWHGASPTEPMTHVAIQDSVDGRTVEWMEKVSDAEYLS